MHGNAGLVSRHTVHSVNYSCYVSAVFDSFAGRETSGRFWSPTIKGIVGALALAIAATAAMCWHWFPSKSDPNRRVYTATTLPGMAIDAPHIVLREGGYAKGRILGAAGNSAGPNSFEVAWSPGGTADEATARKIASVMVKKTWPGTSPSIATHAVEIGRQPGIRLLAHDGDQSMVIALVTCGKRGVSIGVVGDSGAAEIADHMIASFTCTPDPSRDVFRSEVVFASSPSWSPRPDKQIIDGPGDLDVMYIAFTSEGGGSVADRVQRYVPAEYQLTTPSSQRGDKVLWTGTRPVDTKPLPIAVLAWRCNDDHRVAMAVVESASSQPLEEGVAFAATGRCLPPEHSVQ